MSSLGNLFSKFTSYMYKHYGENPGTMLVHTGVLGWIFSAAGQLFAIALNDKIPKEQKSFLYPQEAADAAINILSFYIITSSFKNVASKLVSTGKLSTSKIRNYIKSKGINPAEYIGKLESNIEKDFPEIKDDYKAFKNGVDVVASTVGSILSCNIVTPVLRNQYAAKKQKEAIAEMHKNDPQKDVKPKTLSMDAYIKMASLKFPSSNLKI